MFVINIFLKSYSLFFLCYFSAISSLHAGELDAFKYPFYFGATYGFGNTTWQGLIPPSSRQNFAMSLSTPTDVSEGGDLYGFAIGYEFLPYLALEANYKHYPDATVTFDPFSIFSFEHNGITSFVTKTETVSLMAKIMMIIPHTNARIYSSLGAAESHRRDQINNSWILSPTFGGGINYQITPHVMAELGAVYVAGRGESELNPVEDYFPFLYSVFLQVSYKI